MSPHTQTRVFCQFLLLQLRHSRRLGRTCNHMRTFDTLSTPFPHPSYTRAAAAAGGNGLGMNQTIKRRCHARKSSALAYTVAY